MDLISILMFVMIGGAVGAVARFLVQGFFARFTSVPGWGGVLFINVLGSLAIGFFVTLLPEELAHHLGTDHGAAMDAMSMLELHELLALSAVGFCGAFTTFSTFSLDSAFLLVESRRQFLLNVFGSTGLALFAVFLGILLGKAVGT
ncbi:MAG: CrcB family protein [Phycisphaerales bacterium]|nr:CrcB family protein [Phycisphaerales bacterium]